MKLNEVKTGKSVADLDIKYRRGDFNVCEKNLTSLKGSPQEVSGSFFCSSNELTTLEGGPQKVGGDFICSYNDLTSLNGAPPEIGGNFYCNNNNKLTSLEGAPWKVDGDFVCNENDLTSLNGAPKEVGGNFICRLNSKLASLKNIHKVIKKIDRNFDADWSPIRSHVLGLLLIKDLKAVKLFDLEIAAIINAHLDGGSMHSALNCQHALIKAGFSEYAKL